MINFQALGQSLAGEMEFRGDTAKRLGEQWGVSKRTVQNATLGKVVTANLFMQICVYTGANPLSYWQEGYAVDYSALSGGEDGE